MSSRNSISPTFDYNVYTGIWFDHARGRVLGGRLTLERSQGAILIAFLALFVAAAGAGTWKIARLLLHRNFSSPTSADGIYLQRQAILRNAETALTAAWDTLQTSLAWRSTRTRNNFRRLLPVTVVSILLTVAFAASGILSSRVIQSAAPSEGGNLVLLAGKDCRSAEWSKVDDPSENLLTDASESYNRKKRALVDLNYQLRCYQNGLDGSSCGTYRKPKLQYGFTNVAPCPFTSDVCTSENNTIVLDSGLVDSATDLGFNGNPSFQVRQTRACSPLKADRFKRNVTTEDGDTVLGYFLPVSSPSNASDTMLWRIPYPKAPSYNANISLSADYRTGVSYDPSHLMELLPDYTGGRTSFISLDASELIYYNTSADPWFSINTPLYGNDTNTTTPLYVADEPLNIMGCVTTTFVCNPYGLDKSKNCITTNSDMKFSDSLATLWPHTSERAVVQGALRFLPSNWVFNADTYFRIPGLPVMESQYWLTSGIQSDIIPSDRWQTEMRFAFEASLASLQAQMVQVASGYVYWNPANSGRNVEVVGEECEPLETCQTVCDRQLIRSPGYLSFSLFGVIMIIVIGFVLIVTGFCIEWIVFTIERVSRGGVKSFAEIEWRNCSALQLQRLGYEAAGLGAWSGADGAVPVTKPGDDLGVLDTTNVKHARLMRQDVVEGRSSQEATVHDAFLWGKTGPQRLKTEELS